MVGIYNYHLIREAIFQFKVCSQPRPVRLWDTRNSAKVDCRKILSYYTNNSNLMCIVDKGLIWNSGLELWGVERSELVLVVWVQSNKNTEG